MFLWYLLSLAYFAEAALVFNVSSTVVNVANSRLTTRHVNPVLTVTLSNIYTSFSKTANAFTKIVLDGIDLLGTGILYYDCHCIPPGGAAYTPPADFIGFVNGTDSSGTPYVGIITNNTYVPTGQVFQKTWFIRGEETSIHHFTRVAYHNSSVPNLLNLLELRSLFRPSSDIFTHLVSDLKTFAPLPSDQAVANEITVQDTTWYLGNTPNDPYVQQFSDYFTKYTFANSWRDQIVHGMYGDGSTSNGTPFGAWNVMFNKETYFGGPTHSDLLVDGIVYGMLTNPLLFLFLFNGFFQTILSPITTVTGR
jgi:rhamnogalacturonan endolyase